MGTVDQFNARQIVTYRIENKARISANRALFTRVSTPNQGLRAHDARAWVDQGFLNFDLPVLSVMWEHLQQSRLSTHHSAHDRLRPLRDWEPHLNAGHTPRYRSD